MNKKISRNLMLFLSSALIMMLEILFYHVLIYIKNYLEATSIISVALLGISVGGIGGYFLSHYKKENLLPVISLSTSIFILLCVFNCIYAPQLLKYPVILFLPFFGLGSIVTYFFIDLKEHKAYFWNLTGAAAGVLSICILIPLFKSENVLIIIICLTSLSSLLVIKNKLSSAPGVISVIIALLALSAFFVNIQTNFFDFAKNTKVTSPDDRFKVYRYLRNIKKAKILYSSDNLLARVDVIDYGKNNPKYLDVFQEGVISDNVTSFDTKDFYWGIRIPNKLIKNPRTLVIGTSAEGVTKNAKILSNGNMVGVEINPSIVKLMNNELYNFSKKVYEDIPVHVMDARTYLESNDEKFDMITMLNTHTRGRTTGNVGIPQYLFTQESFSMIFDHLTDNGALLIEELHLNDYSNFFIRKILSSVIGGLQKQGVEENFHKHFYAYTYLARGFRFYIIIIKKQPFNRNEIGNLNEWFNIKQKVHVKQQLKRIKVPKSGKIHHSKLNPEKYMSVAMHPDRMLYNKLASFVRFPVSESKRVLQTAKIDLSPITDNKPFLFDFDIKHPQVWYIFWSSIISVLLLIIIPVTILFIKSVSSKTSINIISVLYFALIGMAYMLVEIVLMQKYQLYLGSPIYSLIIVLTSIFIFSGVGSLLSGKFNDHIKKIFIFAIPLLLIIYTPLLKSLFKETMHFAFPLKTMVSLLSLAPLFICMGVPFPFGLTKIKNNISPSFAALVYGINGAFSTIGVTLSLLLSVYYGFTLTFYLGTIFYLSAFIIILFIKTD